MNIITLLCLACSLALAAAHQPPDIDQWVQKRYDSWEDLQKLSPGIDQWIQKNYDSQEDQQIYVRQKRQARDLAVDLALSHQGPHGKDRPVGKPHGRFDLQGVGKNSRNYHLNGGGGLGSVIWRSKNKKHSIGIGAYGSQGRGKSHGFRYKTRPSFGGGIGYKFRF